MQMNTNKPQSETKIGQWRQKRHDSLRQKYGFEDRQSFFFCYLLLLFPFLFFLVFWVYVNVDSVALSFQDADGGFTLAHYKELFSSFVKEDRFGLRITDIIKRTFITWLVTQIVFIPSMLSTYILYRKLPGHYIFRTIYTIPGVLGGVVLTMIYKYFVNANGPLLLLAENFGVNIPLEVQMKGLLGSSTTAFTTLCLMIAIPGSFAFNFVISGAYARVPADLYEVGALDGLGFIREFFTVVIPLIWGTLVITVVGAMSGIFLTDNGSFLYTNGQYDTACMGYYIFINTKQVADNNGSSALLGYPSALGVMLTLVTVPIVLTVRHIMEKVNDVAY